MKLVPATPSDARREGGRERGSGSEQRKARRIGQRRQIRPVAPEPAGGARDATGEIEVEREDGQPVGGQRAGQGGDDELGEALDLLVARAASGRARARALERRRKNSPMGARRTLVAAADQRQHQHGQRAAVERDGREQAAGRIPLALARGRAGAGGSGRRDRRSAPPAARAPGNSRPRTAALATIAITSAPATRAGGGRQPAPAEPGQQRGQRRQQQQERARAAASRAPPNRTAARTPSPPPSADEETDRHVSSCPAAAVRDELRRRLPSQPFDNRAAGLAPGARYLIT